jgi:hypothetical protein
MPGDVAGVVAKRAEHKPAPRDGEGYYRHSVLRGYWGKTVPSRYDYPLQTACAGCRKTIACPADGEPWEHVQWT